MSAGEIFFDTNVLVYLLSRDEAKANTTEELAERGGTIIVQVLNELANVARRRLAMPWPEVIELTRQVQTLFSVVPLTVETHTRGLQVAKSYELSVYDSTIVAAALLAGCSTLLSEDLQNGQTIDGQLTIHNPFLAAG